MNPEVAERSLPNILGEAGYRTGVIGRLHLAPAESFRFDFDERDFEDTRESDRVAEMAEGFIEDTPAQPFFLMVNYADPHLDHNVDQAARAFLDQVDGVPSDPMRPSARTILPFQQIDSPEARTRTAGYYNSVRRLDEAVGRLLDVLARHDLNDDTVVLFISDHGPPFSRAKASVYEAGVRIPFIVRWPGVSKPRKSAAMVSTIDVTPTILDAAGLPAPAGLHGSSLRRVLASSEALWREYLVAEFHFHARPVFYPQRSIRNDRYESTHNLLAGRVQRRLDIDEDPASKIARSSGFDGSDAQTAFRTFADPPEFELYDLQADPVEFHDLAGRAEHRLIEALLKNALLQYRREIEDPFLAPEKLDEMLALAEQIKPDRLPWFERLANWGD